ncbi:MAG: NAD(P)/FAD-dependent oxidoreductase [Bacteroidaceae bacterium]|nr:NAD(P)/FAD-dependent oxidoreductase [Bacteroidaceae bacterium]
MNTNSQTHPTPLSSGEGHTDGASLLIIGAGPGGYRAAVHAAHHGLKVTIFEGGHVGGTCLNVGCIPTKTYVHSASFAEAVERQPQVVEQLRGGVETLLAHPNITLVKERASFIDAHTVETPSGQRFSAENIIIATGSSSKMLPIPGVDGPRVVDSTGLLQLKELPRRLCIIGAGVIGMEFASVFQRFGSEVVVIEYLKECLPMVDGDIAKRLRKQLEKRGITFFMGAGVKAIDGAAVLFEQKGKELSVEADVILMATGRKPNVSPDFVNAGLEFDERKGVVVNEQFQTSVPGIFAIGDVNGRQMLAHAAEMQGIHVVNSLLGQPDELDFSIMPAAIFTEPEAACVGPSEDQLKAAGTPFECHKAFYRANGKALAMKDTEGMLKLCCEPGRGRILSCHVFGAHAADLVQEASVLMCCHATVAQLRSMVHIHPTLSELLLAAAEA